MDRKKIVSLFFFGLIVFSIVGFVSAAESTLFNSLKGNQLLGPIFDLFGFTSSEGFATFLLATLVIMMVYSLISFVPFFGDSVGIQWAASIIIGVLAFLYVNVDTVVSLLGTYEALGIVLSVAVPFLIVLGFSVQLETHAKNSGHPVFSEILSNLVVWGFVIWILVNLVSSAGGLKTLFEFKGANVFRGVYFIALIFGIIWAITKKKIISRANWNKMENDLSSYKEQVERANAALQAQANSTLNIERGPGGRFRRRASS